MRNLILATLFILFSLGAVNPHEHDYFFHRRKMPDDGKVTHQMVIQGRQAYVIVREVRIGKVPMTLWVKRSSGVIEEFITLDEDFISGVGMPLQPGEGLSYTAENRGQRVSILATIHP